MVTLTLNLAGCGLVLLIGFGGIALFFVSHWIVVGYHRRCEVEDAIAYYNARHSEPTDGKRVRSINRGTRSSYLPAKPFVGLGWLLAGQFYRPAK